jgi:hypothetical protein
MEITPRVVPFSDQTMFFSEANLYMVPEERICRNHTTATEIISGPPTIVNVYCTDQVRRTAKLHLLLKFFPHIESFMDTEDGKSIDLYYNWTSEEFDSVYNMVQFDPDIRFRDLKLLELCYWLNCSEHIYTLFDIDQPNRTPEELARIQAIIPKEIILSNLLSSIKI